MFVNQIADNKRIAKNTIYMYIRMLVSMVVSLYTARITLKALGFDNYGIYNIVGSIIVLFMFLNQGLTTATRRYITAELAKGTLESQKNVFNLTIWSHVGIAGVILIISETVGLYIVNFVLNIPAERMFAANIAYQMSVLATIIAVMQVPFTVAITAHERMNIFAYISLFSVFCKLGVAYGVLLIPGDKLIIYSILVFLAGLLDVIIYRVYCYHSFPMCRYQRPYGRSMLREMFKYMGWNLLGQMVILLTTQGVSILVNLFFSVVANAAMGISNQITNIVNNFVANFQIAFNPQITKLYVTNEHEAMNNLAIRSARMSTYLVLIFLIPICFQIQNFLTVWLGDYPQYAIEFCILTLLAIFIDSTSAPLWMILSADKDVKKYQITMAVIGSFNFFGAWGLFVLGFPPYSVVIIRIIVICVGIIAKLFLVKERVPTYSVKIWFYEVVIGAIKVLAIPVAVLWFITRYSFGNDLANLIAFCGVAVILTVLSIYILGLKPNERSFVNNKVLAVLRINRS